MSYAVSKRPESSMPGSSRSEDHRKVTLFVYQLVTMDEGHRAWCKIDTVIRTVMSRDGKLMVRYRGEDFELKKLAPVSGCEDWFNLKLRDW